MTVGRYLDGINLMQLQEVEDIRLQSNQFTSADILLALLKYDETRTNLSSKNTCLDIEVDDFEKRARTLSDIVNNLS